MTAIEKCSGFTAKLPKMGFIFQSQLHAGAMIQVDTELSIFKKTEMVCLKWTREYAFRDVNYVKHDKFVEI